MTIDLLSRRPELLEQSAALMCGEFGKTGGLPAWRELFRHALTPGSLPQIVLAAEGNAVVGTAGLLPADLMSRQDLSPWLACLVVREDRRGHRIGQAIQRFAVDWCRAKGFERLYLYTDLVNYYEKTGWHFLCHGFEDDGRTVQIYDSGDLRGGAFLDPAART